MRLHFLTMFLIFATVLQPAFMPFDSRPAQKKIESKKAKDNESGQQKSEQINDARPITSAEEKRQRAIALIDGVLLSADKIAPVEYRILTEIEAAALIWQFDKERALPLLKDAITLLRKLLNDKGETTEISFPNRRSKEQRL